MSFFRKKKKDFSSSTRRTVELEPGLYTTLPGGEYSLLIEATQAKQDGDIENAIELLKTAYAKIKEEKIIYGIQTYLRLPLYLQEAGRGDEAWKEFNNLIISATSDSLVMYMDHSIIYDKMRLFLQREGNNKAAIHYGFLSYFSWAIGLNQQNRRRELSSYLSPENYKKKINTLLKKSGLYNSREDFYRFIEEEKIKFPKISLHEIGRNISSLIKEKGKPS